jgi:Right handed beta helix region
MNTTLSLLRARLGGALACLLLLVSFSAHAATYSLQIIAPRAGMTTANRYYKAYPGLDYNVQTSVVGGKYPYTYTLSSAPSGMTIDANLGIVDWPSPTTGSTSVTVGVTDSSGTKASVTWPITVTTSGFKFVDANKGKSAAAGADGSIGNPFKTIADFYITKNDSSNAGVFIYFRAGTYFTNTAPIENGVRLALVPGHPLVWLGYPSEAAVIDCTGSYIAVYGGMSNTYMDNLTFQNFNTNFGVRIDSDASDVVFRRDVFQNIQAGWGGEGTNAAGLMIDRGSTMGSNYTVIGNTFQHVHDVGYGVLGYFANNVLVQSNTCTDFTTSDDKCIGPKEGTQNWFIRDNRISMAAGQGIWIDASNTGSTTTQNIEVSYNLVQVTSGNTFWLGQADVAYGPVTSFRNTYVGAPVEVDNLTSGGPVTFTNDVIQTSNSGAIATNIGTIAASLLSTVSNLTASSGIVDSTGNLTGSYTKYLGIDGYQRTGSTSSTGTGTGGTTPPAAAVVPDPPTAVSVQ